MKKGAAEFRGALCFGVSKTGSAYSDAAGAPGAPLAPEFSGSS